MKNLLLVITALLVVCGVVSINLWTNLQRERQTNTELTSQLAGSSSMLPAPVTPVTPAASAQSLATPPTAAAPVAALAAEKAAPALVESEVFTRATTAAITATISAAGIGINDSDLLKNPEYRKALVTQARFRLAQSNPGLAEALGLSLGEADRLFDVMAESQVALTVELTEMTAKAGGAAPAISAMTQRAAGREDPARAVLGEARYALYQNYQRNAKPALAQVASMSGTLNAAAQPLNDSQSRAVATAILAEQQRQRQEAAVAPRANPNPGVQRNVADTLAEFQKTREDTDRRLLEAASPHLNAVQIDLLQKKLEQQAAQSRRTIETARDLDTRRQALPQTGSTPARNP